MAESTQTFLLVCPDVGQEGEGEVWGLNILSNQTSKMESDYLLKFTSDILLMTEMCYIAFN